MLCTNQCKLCSRTRTRGIPRQTSQSAHSQNPAKLIGSPATLIRRTVVAAAIRAIDFPWAMSPLLGVHPSSSPCSCVSCPGYVVSWTSDRRGISGVRKSEFEARKDEKARSYGYADDAAGKQG